MHRDCPECKRLSEILSEATNNYFSALERSQLAKIENNPTLVSAMETLKLTAAEKRQQARQELRQHQTIHHYADERTAWCKSISGVSVLAQH
jgi:hypothetical protein